jgi:hypothetical protein
MTQHAPRGPYVGDTKMNTGIALFHSAGGAPPLVSHISRPICSRCLWLDLTTRTPLSLRHECRRFLLCQHGCTESADPRCSLPPPPAPWTPPCHPRLLPRPAAGCTRPHPLAGSLLPEMPERPLRLQPGRRHPQTSARCRPLRRPCCPPQSSPRRLTAGTCSAQHGGDRRSEIEHGGDRRSNTAKRLEWQAEGECK